MQFKERFNELLKEFKLTQKDICKASNIPSSLMSNYSTGRAVPSLENAVAIADAFNISVDTLLGRVVNYERSLLSPEENELLSKFKLMSRESQKNVIGYVDFLGYQEYKEKLRD